MAGAATQHHQGYAMIPDQPAHRDPAAGHSYPLADTAAATRRAMQEPTWQYWRGRPEAHEGPPIGRMLMLLALIVVVPAVGALLLALVAWLYLTFAI